MAYTRPQLVGFLALIFLLSLSNYVSRFTLIAVLEPIKIEFGVSDAQLGLLSGAAFAITYSLLSVPVARWADFGNRGRILAIAAMIWSVATMACGMAHSFFHLIVARLGVGIGEAGAVAPAQSLVSDYVRPEHRARAFALFPAAGSIGLALGLAGGGWVAETYGWRWSFIVAGAPGALLAIATWLFLAEPRRQFQKSLTKQNVGSENILQVFLSLWSIASWRLGLIAFCCYGLFVYGALVFMPSYLIRVVGLDIAAAGALYGWVSGIAGLLGTAVGAWVTDKFGAKDQRWLMRLPACAVILASVPYLMAFTLRDNFAVLTSIGFGDFLLAMIIPGLFAAMHGVCGAHRRATGSALYLFGLVMIGSVCGPYLTGLISDMLQSRLGSSGLPAALMIVGSALLVAGTLLWRAGDHYEQDAGSANDTVIRS
jgi:predicted MFS family arabinose efflux permease